eukprot:3672631-Alexandrium_andersonii.AAC.1
MGRSLNPRRGPGTWLGRRRVTASHTVAVSARDVRGVRAVARRPLGERWPREVLQGLVSAPWARRAESAPADGGQPQAIPRVPQKAAEPPPHPRAA